jgi:hypothetical protein
VFTAALIQFPVRKSLTVNKNKNRLADIKQRSGRTYFKDKLQCSNRRWEKQKIYTD